MADTTKKRKPNNGDKLSVVIGVIGSDCHAVGNKIIDFTLRDEGFNVTNVGVLASQEDFVNAAVETNADAIIVSSIYGQGELDCKGLREKLDEAGMNDILLFVGGNIVIGKQDFSEVEKRFKAMGYDYVYGPGVPIEEDIKQLREIYDLA
jgi:methylaspartate mutase sigma subunit